MNYQNRKFIYFPSLSCGEFALHLIKDWKIKDKVPARFYSDQIGKYKYPYFLISAGHNLKNTREDFGCNKDVLIMGDSGGFQICSGAMKWNNDLTKKIFEWLEKNTDIAMNLDIPPRLKWSGRFQEALEISERNFEYFYKNKTGKTKFLNVLHGTNQQDIEKWYKVVSKFKFDGWAVGGVAGNEYALMQMFAYLLENKEHLKPENKYFHILGTSAIDQFYILSALQKSLNDVGSPMQITTDSSSPNRSVLFGTYYMGFSLKNMVYETLKMPYRKDVFIDELSIPYVTEFDKVLKKVIKYKDIKIWKGVARTGITLHNLYVFLDVLMRINDLVYSEAGFIDQILTGKKSRPYADVIRVIDKIVKSDNPLLTFEQNGSLFHHLSGRETISNNINQVNKFYDYK